MVTILPVIVTNRNKKHTWLYWAEALAKTPASISVQPVLLVGIEQTF